MRYTGEYGEGGDSACGKTSSDMCSIFVSSNVTPRFNTGAAGVILSLKLVYVSAETIKFFYAALGYQ